MSEIVTSLKVRKAIKKDTYHIAELSSEVAKEGIVKEFTPEELMDILSGKGHYVAVAKLDKEVVGYAMSTYSWGKLHILDTAVKKDKRRMGIGKLLIKHLIDHAIKLDFLKFTVK